MSRTDSDVDELPYDTTDYETLDWDEGEEEGLLFEEEEVEVFHSEDFISTSKYGPLCTLKSDILEFDFSYGYDCKRHFNLVVADEQTLIFASGNLINFFNTETKEIWFRRSALGGGIGHITKNPNPEFPHIAIAENGHNPPIIIYNWPTLDIVAVLKGGSAKIFSHVSYNPNGSLMVSQSGDPDYLITVWNWPKSKILLRTKSYVNDVFRVMFSPSVPGHLTTSGVAHIKFWKMAKTFTGLKLQGELGRFGKTEYSDILGIYPMPDEKVISGCFWGNFLIWDEGLIKVEVFRKLRKNCHEGPIVQFDYKDGELWTVAMDGRVRVWAYEAIDQADPPDDDRVVQVEPVHDFHCPGLQFMCIVKQNDNEENTFYYAQDGNGGLWRIDLNTDADPQPPEQLYKCHAGGIADIASCPWGTYLASLGLDGRLHIYNYLKRTLIFIHEFPAKGKAMIWLPIVIQGSGDQLIMGFDDGNLRSVGLMIDERTNEVKLFLLQVIKPHNRPITVMSINGEGNILVTGGEDKTIFVFQVANSISKHTILLPIGYIFTPDIPTCFTWHHTEETTIIIGCMGGKLMQVEVPKEQQDYTKITYILYLEPIENKFITYKAQIRRDIRVRAINARKEEKKERKRKEMQRILAENPGLEIDEEIFLADSESEETLTPLHIPEIPNKVLWIQSLQERDALWLSMGGYDAGYVYEYRMEQKAEVPQSFRMIYDADDTEISSFIYNYNRKYLIFAMQDGVIRVNKVNPEDYMDLTDYWKISMHDNLNGFVPRMCFSYDEKYFFSCGHDGNVFSYQFYPEDEDYIVDYPTRSHTYKEEDYIFVEDVTDYTTLSLEETIVKAEYDRVMRVANERKARLRAELEELGGTLLSLVDRNEKLLPTQVLPRSFFELDPIITNDLEDKLNAKLALVKRKQEFQVERSRIAMKKLMDHFVESLDLFPIFVTGLNCNRLVRTLRQKKITEEFEEMQSYVDRKIIEDEAKGRPPERPPAPPEVVQVRKSKDVQLEYFLMGLSPSTINFKLGAKLTRLLNKYRARKAKLEKRKEEWEEFNKRKPAEGVNHPDDEAALALALKTIGDYKLKTAFDYKVPPSQRETTVKKYKELLDCRQRQYDLRHNFNEKVYALREEKVATRKKLLELQQQLEDIHHEIPASKRLPCPEIPPENIEEFPETNLKFNVVFPEKPWSNISMQDFRIIGHVMPASSDQYEKFTLPVEGEEYPSSWEMEAKRIRLTRKLFEQKELIKEMGEIIAHFDETLDNLIRERIQVRVDAKFMDIHLLKVNQELIILKDFESKEDALTDKVNTKIMELMDMQDKITDVNNTIETCKSDILRLQDDEKVIQTQFLTAAGDNKFYDFLRRIFKKKYKPPKIRDPDDEDDSSSESSSDDESDDDLDEGSIDSRDFGIIRLDESVCPKGCDQHLFDLTYSLRGQRHQIELQIKEITANIANYKKDAEGLIKKLKLIEASVETTQNELEAYQREKQKRLNQVMVTVVMKFNQIQNLLKDKDFALNKISDSLVFSQPALTKLYKRVGQLQIELIKQKAKHKLNVKHLSRMKTDCSFMSIDISRLKKDVVEAMTIKFGKVIDIDEVLEAHLKRLVYDLRMSLTDVRGLYEYEMRLWKKRYLEQQVALSNAIKENTEKMDLLAVLSKEKTELAKYVNTQEHKREHLDNVVDVSLTLKKDISKLAEVVDNQKKEIENLKNEIKRLNTKGLSLKEWDLPDLSKPDVIEEEEDDGLDWGGTMEEFFESHWEYYAELERKRYMEDEERREKLKLDIRPSGVEFKIKDRTLTAADIEEMIKSILLDMVEDLDNAAVQLKITSVMDLLIEKVIRSSSIREIIKILFDNLPLEESDLHQGIVETTAEKLYGLHEVELTKSEILVCATDILEEIIDISLSEKGHTIYMISELVSNLVHELTLGFLLKPDIMDMILSRLTSNLSFIDIDKDELVESLTSLSGPLAQDMKTLMNTILEKVFGIGIDYLYVLNEQFKSPECDKRFSITIPVKSDFSVGGFEGEEEAKDEQSSTDDDQFVL